MAVYFFYETTDPVPFSYLSPTRQVGPMPPPYESEMSPSDYLEFAIEDIATDTSRGIINSFGNAKRAFHLAIDSLLNQYGLFTRFRKSNFPEKARLIDAVGMIPIGIMHNLNVERNLLEHEYTVPSKARVNEAIDITKLLLLAMEKLVEATPQEAVIGWRTPSSHVLMQLEPHAAELRFFRITAPGKYKKSHGITHVTGVRTMSGELDNEVKVAKTPWKTIPLDRGHESEWQPIIKELVNAQRRSNSRNTFVDREHATMSLMVTLPLSLPDGVSWHELLERAFKEKWRPKANSTESNEKGVEPVPSPGS